MNTEQKTYDMVIRKHNESFLKIDSEADIAYELSEAFTFYVDGYAYSPLYKMGKWDGTIKIFKLGPRLMPFGLLQDVIKFCIERGYTYLDDARIIQDPLTIDHIVDYIDTLGFSSRMPPINVRDYQIKAIQVALNDKRVILNSSVASGKSLILGVICRYLTEKLNLRVLIIVPTIGLTTQMKSDFADYFGHTGWNADDSVHCITSGADKTIQKPITISTFQSIYKADSKWLNQFGCFIADEAHRVIAKTITGIFEKATGVSYKIGCTGTVSTTKCNILVMKGITGPIHDIISTAELIERKQLVPLTIKAVVLNYPKDTCKEMKDADYDTELNYIVTNEKRLKFITNLALSCKGTTLVLFRFVEKCGLPLYNMISEKAMAMNRIVKYIDGGVAGIERELIRKNANRSDDILVCSQPTMSTGVNLPAIESIIFAHPTKSDITVLQSVGRGLRLKEGKNSCVLYDITDNLSYLRHSNITFKHFGERLNTYTKAGFKFNITNIEFKP